MTQRRTIWDWTLRERRIWRIKREWMRSDGMCFYCGVKLKRRFATVDHVVPRSKGGSEQRQNLVLACRRCNERKRDDPPSVLMGLINGQGVACVRTDWLTEQTPLRRIATMTDEKIAGFNYESLKTTQRKQIQKHTEVIHQLIEKTAEACAEIGRRLIAGRESMDGAQFQGWIKAEFRWSQSQASNYMRVAKKFGHLDCLKNFQPTALYRLTRRATGENVVETMIERAKAGETITHSIVRDAISREQMKPHSKMPKRSTPDVTEAPEVEAAAPAVAKQQQLRFDFDGIRQTVREAAAAMAAKDVEHLADELVDLANELISASAEAKPEKPTPTSGKAASKPKRSTRRGRTQAAEAA